ncbi:MAG: CinA family nicotinamide mononucleotide deamidase-related protein [Actinobacteria bacterium]|nr:CinA family nicotinamide mononucleotide deamidase-related protein [Actinomycetota bacterium]
MKSAIICIGTELNLGLTVNTNATYISEKLAENGIECNLIITIKDDEKDIIDALNYSLNQSDTVIISGGLGPTDDDITRKAVSEALSLKLYKDDKLDNTSLKFKKKVLTDKLRDRLLRQSYIPEGSIPFIPNIGSASGFMINLKGRNKRIFSIPGVPGEMKDMFNNNVLPVLINLSERSEDNLKLKRKILLTTGISESEIEEKIKDIYKESDVLGVKIGITAMPGLIKLVIVSRSSSDEINTKNINIISGRIKKEIGFFIYGENDDLMMQALKKSILNYGKKITISTAESMTGGLISSMITDIPGSSDYFCGGIISYSNYAKMNLLNVKKDDLNKYGAVSEQVCRQMALSSKKIFNSDYAIGVSGFAGPEADEKGKNVGLVYTCIAKPDGSFKIFESRFTGTRTEIKFRVSQFVLNMIRIEIEKNRVN